MVGCHAQYSSSRTFLVLWRWRFKRRGMTQTPRDTICRATLSAQPIEILLHEIAAHCSDVGVGQALGDRTRHAAAADLAAVEAAHGGDAEAGGGQEHLFGIRRVEEIDVAFNCRNA